MLLDTAVQVRSISAWAEASRMTTAELTKRGVYLRVGGGIVPLTSPQASCAGLSPRGRRHRSGHMSGAYPQGSISAWAEASWMRWRTDERREVYLRVGGGICRLQPPTRSTTGLSPRGRRHPASVTSTSNSVRSISAWAEAS